MLENIPDEMKNFNSWLVWKFEDHGAQKPTKVPYDAKTNKHASVTDNQTWSTFAESMRALHANDEFDGIGFVLSENDPYSIIDLDDTEGNAEEFERQKKIFEMFDSYSELSPSSKGLHIIVRGKLPPGRRRRANIEVYTSERYMTMTGNVFKNKPIEFRQELLNILVDELGRGAPVNSFGNNAPEKYSDEEIYNRACNAINGAKFMSLWAGEWNGVYPSQSEADQALINIIVFYTQNYAQIARMFRYSALGKRYKAQRDAYLFGDRYGMVPKAFDKMIPPIDISVLQNELEAAIRAQKTAPPPPSIESQIIEGSPYTVPPGLIGEIAQYIYSAAARPVPEIALGAAIGLFAGICGRAYNVSGTGLNQYLVVVAQTGVGKEALSSGISRLIKAVNRTVPAANEFVGPSEIASPQALIKYIAKSQSFVSIMGEFGLLLETMTGKYAQPNMISLRRMFLDLYGKSGVGQTVGKGIWSDTQKNTAVVDAPSFSILGESTPEKFYGVLSEDLITEGFLPRFSIIEYKGIRPELNEDSEKIQPDARLVEHLAAVCNQALILNQQNSPCIVKLDDESKYIFKRYNKHCDLKINTAGEKQVIRELYTRAWLKALKLAALISVGQNPFVPTVDKEAAEWAIRATNHDVEALISRFDQGKVGGATIDEEKQALVMRKLFSNYVLTNYDSLTATEKQKSTELMHYNKIVPYSLIMNKTFNMSAFKNDKNGSSFAVSKTLKALLDAGDIVELGPVDKLKYGSASARMFVIKAVAQFLGTI